MFKFAGHIGRKRFFWASALRIGLFFASIAGLPSLFSAVAAMAGCRGTDACGAVGLLGASVFKPLAFALFVFSFAGIAMRRTRDSGIPAWIGLIVLVLLVADHRFLVFAGAPWSFAFPAGVQRASFPYFTLLALICVGVLCALPSRGDKPLWRDPFGKSDAAPVPVRSLLTLALALTIVTFAWAMPAEVSPSMLPIVFLMQLSVAALPTFVLHFCLLLTLTLVITRRSAGSIALLALAVLPFAQWAYTHWETSRERELEVAEIAAIPTEPATRVPATIVVESASTTGMDEVWTVPGIQHLISKGAYGRALMQFERPTGQNRLPLPRAVESVPDEYLLLKIGRASGFAKRRLTDAAAGGPLELRLVDSERDVLIAVWYRSFHSDPPGVPLLTMNGWYHRTNGAMTHDIEGSIREFLAKALIASP